MTLVLFRQAWESRNLLAKLLAKCFPYRNRPKNYNFSQLSLKTGDKAPRLLTPVSAPGAAGRTKDIVRGQTDLGSDERVWSQLVCASRKIVLLY